MASHGDTAGTQHQEPSEGEHVAWRTSQGETTGVVVGKATEDTKIKNFTVKASEQAPKFIVKSDKSGAKAAHKAQALHPADEG